jgi:hypothetical protein
MIITIFILNLSAAITFFFLGAHARVHGDTGTIRPTPLPRRYRDRATVRRSAIYLLQFAICILQFPLLTSCTIHRPVAHPSPSAIDGLQHLPSPSGRGAGGEAAPPPLPSRYILSSPSTKAARTFGVVDTTVQPPVILPPIRFAPGTNQILVATNIAGPWTPLAIHLQSAIITNINLSHTGVAIRFQPTEPGAPAHFITTRPAPDPNPTPNPNPNPNPNLNP